MDKLARIATWAFLATSAAARAGDISFFENGIDYWDVRKKKEEPAQAAPAATKPKTLVLEAADPAPEKPFEWKTYLDPKNREFFKEGDYTPPEPFMEVVRNPTDENLKMWFAYVERKNTLAERFARRMEEYTQTNGAAMPREAKTKVAAEIAQLPAAAPDFKRFRFRAYFESTCPHCQKMFGTLNELQARGYFVEARQIDQGPVEHLGSEVAIVPAGKEELTRFRVETVPLLLVGDMKSQAVYRQSGFMTADEVLAAVKTKVR